MAEKGATQARETFENMGSATAEPLKMGVTKAFNHVA
jgi:hypothetical protein